MKSLSPYPHANDLCAMMIDGSLDEMSYTTTKAENKRIVHLQLNMLSHLDPSHTPITKYI